MPGGIPFDKVKHKLLSGTTSATANEQAKVKKLVPEEWQGCTAVQAILNGEGCYIENGTIGLGRSGVNCPAAEVALAASTSTENQLIKMTDTLWVAVYADSAGSSHGQAVAVSKSGTTLTVGTVAEFNAAATTDIGLVRISDTQFAISYIDDGGDDYLGAIIGTLDGTTITFGDESLLVSAAIVKAAGTAIAIPRSGILAVSYQLAGDTSHYIIAAAFDDDVIDTAGTAVAIVATASTSISMTEISLGRVVVCYTDATTYLNSCVCTVSAAAVCVAGTPEALNSAATTYVTVKKAQEHRGVICYVVAGDATLMAFDVSTTGTTLYQGSAVAVVAGTHLVPSFDMFNPTAGVVIFGDDGHAGKYGKIYRFTVAWTALAGSGGAVTVSAVWDTLAEASTTDTRIATNSLQEFVAMYKDVDATNVHRVCYGIQRDDIIDIRASGASAAFYLTLLPIYGVDEVG